jgi:hypothetical protein
MDDCSETFWKRAIRKYYFNKMPQELATDLKEYNLDPDFIKISYIKKQTKCHLATFAKF